MTFKGRLMVKESMDPQSVLPIAKPKEQLLVNMKAHRKIGIASTLLGIQTSNKSLRKSKSLEC